MNFHFEDVSLKQAIDQLIAEFRIPIVYQDRRLRGQRVTATCRQCREEEALEVLLLNSNLVWERVGEQFIVVASASEIRGQVVLKTMGIVLSGVEVVLLDERRSKILQRELTSSSGRFDFRGLRPGVYSVKVRAHGFREYLESGIHLEKQEKKDLSLGIEEAILSLQEIQVPSTYAFSRDATMSTVVLSRDQIDRMPRFGDDVYRSVEYLPGISSEDLTSTFRIRGGDIDETLILFDGVELEEPFHLRRLFSGLFSVIDAQSIGDLELITGAMPAEYGNKLSGVFTINTRPFPDRQQNVELTTLGLKLKTQGPFLDGRGSYTLAFRDSFFGIRSEVVTTEFAEIEADLSLDSDVSYNDAFAKIRYQIGRQHLLSANILLAGDHAVFDESGLPFGREGFGKVDALSRNDLFWLTLRSLWSDGLLSETVLFSGAFDQDADAFDELGFRRFEVHDHRRYRYRGLRQSWSFDWRDKHFAKWGLEVKRAEIDLSYANRRGSVDPISSRILLNGNLGDTAVDLTEASRQYGLYFADRVRLLPTLSLEAGLRYDSQSHTRDSQWSPRAHLAYSPQTKQLLKLGWGRYYQPQSLFRIQVEDGIDVYHPAELAEHWVLAYQHQLRGGFRFRGEAYAKHFAKLRPRFVNFLDPIRSFPETQPDRIRIEPDTGRARGLEFTLSQRINEQLGWMANYTVSEAFDRVDGLVVPRPWDQREAINLAFDYSANDLWSINLAWHFHTGWRTTSVAFETETVSGGASVVRPVLGDLFAETYPDYHRLDLRYQRHFSFQKRHRFFFYVEVTNLYNRENVRSFSYHQLPLGDSQGLSLQFDTEPWIAQISNFGVNWKF